MGKVSRKRKDGTQKGPLPFKKPKVDQSQSRQSAQTAVTTVKEQLQVTNLEEKLCALQTIGTYLESEEFVKLLIESDIIKIVISLLTDDNSQVRNAAAGTLRNLSNLNHNVCEYLITQNVMIPLVQIFKMYDQNWIPKQEQSKLDEDGDTFLQNIYLLWNLCECSDESVKFINESHILPIFTKCLNRQVYGDEMVITILHSLLVIIEDNLFAIQEIRELCENPLNEFLCMEDSTPSGILLKTLSCGMLLNLKYPNVLTAPVDFIKSVLRILSQVLSADLRESCHKMSSNLPLQSADEINMELEKEGLNLKRLLDAQQMTLEIITNICSPEDDEAMDMDESSEGDSEADDNMSCDGNENGISYVANKLPSEYIEAIASYNIAKLVWDKTSGLAENVVQILNESEYGKKILGCFHCIQSRALLCMNNFIENLPMEKLVGYNNIYQIWIDAGNMVFKASQYSDNVLLLEGATFIMRAAINKLKGDLFQSESTVNISDLFSGLSANDLKDIFDYINKCQHSDIQINLIRMLGNLALILNSKSPADPSDVEIHIAGFLVDRINKETEIGVLGELLDTIMDLFAEDETDKLAQNVKLIGKLNEITPVFKRKVKQQKKTLGDHMVVCSTVITNLPRFVKYKSKRV